jgi:hypothetical protein
MRTSYRGQLTTKLRSRQDERSSVVWVGGTSGSSTGSMTLTFFALTTRGTPPVPVES